MIFPHSDGPLAKAAAAPPERAAQPVHEPVYGGRPRRQPVVALETRVGAVAAEHLVATVTGQHHGHVLACDFRDEVGRHRGFVGERFVEPLLQVGQQVASRCLRQHAFVMPGAEQFRDFPGIRGFRLLVGVEADGECRYVRPEPGRRCDDRARIDAAGKEEAEWYVRDHLVAHGLVDETAEFLRRLVGGNTEGRFRQRHRPVGLRVRRLAGRGVVDESVCRRQLETVAIQCLRRRHVTVAEEVVQRRLVDPQITGIECRLDGFEFRGESQPAAVIKIIERLDAGPIAVQPQFTVPRIPQRDREHAVEVIDEAFAPLEIRPQQHFGIRMGAERMAQFFEFAAEAQEAVYLAVEYDPGFVVVGKHGLHRHRIQVDDRQAAEADMHRPVEVQAAIVGAAVFDRRERGGKIPGRVRPADEATHVEFPVSWRCRQLDTLFACPAARNERCRLPDGSMIR
jgi:hypothetical protein